MKSYIVVFLMFIVSSLCWGQNIVHPYVAAGAVLNGSGQDNIGGSGVTGIIVDAPHLFSYSEAGYETGGKTNDNANVSHKGHDRFLANETLFRKGDWYAGAGIDWLKLYTPAYTKSHVHPRVTVGREFHGGYVNKVLISYVHPGTDWQNGVQGVEAQAWWTFNHVFFRMTAGGYIDHDTLTDRNNKPMTAAQLSRHSLTSKAQFLIGYRF